MNLNLINLCKTGNFQFFYLLFIPVKFLFLSEKCNFVALAFQAGIMRNKGADIGALALREPNQTGDDNRQATFMIRRS